jgi:hypothetical protein
MLLEELLCLLERRAEGEIQYDEVATEGCVIATVGQSRGRLIASSSPWPKMASETSRNPSKPVGGPREPCIETAESFSRAADVECR